MIENKYKRKVDNVSFKNTQDWITHKKGKERINTNVKKYTRLDYTQDYQYGIRITANKKDELEEEEENQVKYKNTTKC